MDGKAFKDISEAWNNEAWKILITNPPSEFDSYIWLYDCEGSWDTSDLNYDAVEKMGEDCLMDHPDFNMRGTNIIKKGCFRSVFPRLNVDEWTYLFGFKVDSSDLEKELKKFASLEFLSPKCFELLRLHDGFLIVYIDGWWECFPSDHLLMKSINKSLISGSTNSEKWSRFVQDFKTEIFPDFNADRERVDRA